MAVIAVLSLTGAEHMAERKIPKRVLVALAKAVKVYGYTFMSHRTNMSEPLIKSVIVRKHNPTSFSVRRASKWYTIRHRDAAVYRVWCSAKRQRRDKLARFARIGKEVQYSCKMIEGDYEFYERRLLDDLSFLGSRLKEHLDQQFHDRIAAEERK